MIGPTRTLPVVSCLLVTRDRVALALQSIDCYAAQRYRARELVVVTDRDADRLALTAAVAARGLSDVRFVHATGPDRPLGDLRNLGLDAARGDLVAQWDDDDLHHPARLSEQVAALGDDHVACFLGAQLLYFSAERTLHAVDWQRRLELEGTERGWNLIPGTAVFRTGLGLRYPSMAMHEDRGLLERLLDAGSCARVVTPFLYVYRQHGANTFDESHLRYMRRWSLDRDGLRASTTALEVTATWLTPFIGGQPVTVRDESARAALTLRPSTRPTLTPDRPSQAAGCAAHVTIAVATWNRAALLRELLSSLVHLRIPAGVTWEVVVCDNASSDDTPDVLAGARLDLPLRVLHEQRQGKSFALLRLLAEARGDWVLFLDDDVLVSEEWLAAYVDGIERYPNAACLGGPVLPWLTEPASGLRGWLLREFPWMHTIVEFDEDESIDPGTYRFVHGANVAVRRAALQLPDDIDTRRGMFGTLRVSGEDLALVSRVIARGWEGWRLSRAVVFHFIPRARSGWRWWLVRQVGEARSRAVDRGLPANAHARTLLLTISHVSWEALRAVLRPYRLGMRARAAHVRLGRGARKLARLLGGG